MVNINNVYQKVLVLSNKEQRGYITPLEFNRLADRAQLEIFESYFHDMKTALHKVPNQSEESDEVEMLLEKISVHRVIGDAITVNTSTGVVDTASFASTPYRLSNIRFGNQVAQEVTQEELSDMMAHPLTRPSANRRVYVRTGENAEQRRRNRQQKNIDYREQLNRARREDGNYGKGGKTYLLFPLGVFSLSVFSLAMTD